MTDPVLLIVGVVVFALMFVAIVLTFLEFRQLTPGDASRRDAARGGRNKP